MTCRNPTHELVMADGTCATCGRPKAALGEHESRVLLVELALVVATASTVLYAFLFWRAA